MNDDIKAIIDEAKLTALENGIVHAETLKKLLELDPESLECEYLGKASKEVMIKQTGGMVRIGSSIGVDIAPCPMNCQFCSLGEKWGLITETHVLSDDKIIELVKNVIKKGFTQITLRTTEFYDINKLCELGRRIRAEVPGDYMLTANTGEVTIDDANNLFYSGFTGMYHTLRLREGVDTPFDPKVRIDSINAAQKSKLMHTVGIEPIGSEHTNDEIIDMIEYFRTLDVLSVCVMKRVNVRGTPLSMHPEISDNRFAQILAVTRIAGGLRWGVATHPFCSKTISYGGNHITVETGANPRGDTQQVERWEPCGHEESVKIIRDAGLKVGQASRDKFYESTSMKINDTVPDFTLESTCGNFNLSCFIKKGPVLLYFYPPENEDTLEFEKQMNDVYDRFNKLGICLVCINDEPLEHHKNLIKHINSKYLHASDTDMKIAKLYEAYIIRASSKRLIGKTNREFFLIGTDMKLKYHWRAYMPDDMILMSDLISNIDKALSL